MQNTAQIVKIIPDWMHRLLLALHLMTLCGAGIMIFLISYDAIRKISFLSDPRYINVQLWICLLFIVDILVEVAMSSRPLRSLFINLPFLVVCIPYISILAMFHTDISGPQLFMFRFLPLIRAAAVFAIITGCFTRNKVSGVLRAFIGMLITIVYFASLMFFVLEHDINTGVSTYGRALWWAIMNMTSNGSNIPEFTELGRIMAISLSGVGFILMPLLTVYIILTVYITNATSNKKSE